MLKTKPTKNLTGINIQGDFNDFYELVESIYNITRSEEDVNSPYYSVSIRLLGICYEIRHAYQGDREVELIDNGMNEEIMKSHSMIVPKQNLYYSVNVLFPEALFVAMSIKELCEYAESKKSWKNMIDDTKRPYRRTTYLRDKSNLEVLSAGIYQAFSDIACEDEADKIINFKIRTDESYKKYLTQYIDELNIDYIKSDVSKRKDKIKSIARKIAKKSASYLSLENDLKYWAKELNSNIHELHAEGMDYPEDFEW